MKSRSHVLAGRAAGSTLARLAVAVVLSLAALCALASGAMARTPQIEIVSQSGPPPGPIPANTSYFTTIQAAVNATKKNRGDWVLVEPGVYHEEVLVTKAHSGIHIRGMNRNTVILDGQHEPAPTGSNGILVEKANYVYIENMTARNYDRAGSDGENGNSFWWTGGDDSGKIGAHGWYGNYLTAYNTGLNGGYGIFTNNETERRVGTHLRVRLQRLGHLHRRVLGMPRQGRPTRRSNTTRSATRARTRAATW